MKKILYWMVDRMLGTYISLFFLGLFMGGALAAGTSYDVGNEPQMYLDVSITNSQTTGIIIASPQRNGSDHIFTTETGGVLRIRQGSRIEDIYYADAARNTTTNRITLDGVVRNICTGITSAFTTCGNGQVFSRGAIVELAVDARLLNLKMNRDRLNTLSGSGQITSSQTDRAWIDANSVTTAQRDAFRASALSDGNIIYNSSLNVMQYRGGSAWISFGSGSTVNASTTVRGGVEIGTGADLYLMRSTDDTGAPLALSTRSLIRTSSGATMSGRIVVTNASGYIDVRAGGTGTGAVITGALLIGRNNNRLHFIDPAANSGDILRSNGTSWKSISPPLSVLDVKTTASSATGASTLAEVKVYEFSIPANSLAAGDVLRLRVSGTFTPNQVGTVRTRIGGLSGAILASGLVEADSGTLGYVLDSLVTIRSIGAGGTSAGDLHFVEENNSDATYRTAVAGSSTANVSVDTTATVRIAFTIQFAVSNASNGMSYQQAVLEKLARS